MNANNDFQGDPNPGGPAEATPKGVFVIDAFPHFQPIRLPAEAFYHLHRSTAESLDDFVDAHFERFPQRAMGPGRFGR